ncbi:MAG: glycoside hydrolase family 1 protein [Candidatus Omnitrophica bacterium]|nr:glycoside hydrolase family 1 protein [Candidatus Omnitrophota bacterium]
MTGTPPVFPKTFLWGSATSSHQIEGENRLNDWWAWESAGKTTDRSGIACDSYKRFEEDFDLVRELHQNAHRFSVEWSRIEPEEGRWDEDALAHYAGMVRALKKRGITPLVTLHHFTNPQWMARSGGWENPRSVFWFKRFSCKVAEVMGGEVSLWITINEPNVLVHKCYIEGDWPPGNRSLLRAVRAMRNLAKAHRAAYAEIHGIYRKAGWDRPMVGAAQHFLACDPLNAASLGDRMAARVRAGINNGAFFWLGGARRGLDFVGVNYYFREVVRASWSVKGLGFLIGKVCAAGLPEAAAVRNDLKWEIFPEGIARVIRAVWRRFGLPIVVTENGICTHDDELRNRFIREHLRAVGECIQGGVDVRGYLYWSLLDNFEWSIGYFPKFGLVAVDPKTQNRTPKPSALYYASICRAGGLT